MKYNCTFILSFAGIRGDKVAVWQCIKILLSDTVLIICQSHGLWLTRIGGSIVRHTTWLSTEAREKSGSIHEHRENSFIRRRIYKAPSNTWRIQINPNTDMQDNRLHQIHCERLTTYICLRLRWYVIEWNSILPFDFHMLKLTVL